MISTRNVVLSAASLVAVASALTVNTPASAVQCQPVSLGWGDGTAPFYVSIIPGGQPSAAALQNLPTQDGTSYTWMVDVPAGTSITVKVVDSTGDVNYSDQITIQQGTTTECSGSSPGAGGAAAGGASSAAPAPASSVAGSASSGTDATSSGALASVRAPLSSASSAVSARTSAAASAASSVSSGIAANAAATTGSTGAAYKGATAGFALLGAGLLFALAA